MYLLLLWAIESSILNYQQLFRCTVCQSLHKDRGLTFSRVIRRNKSVVFLFLHRSYKKDTLQLSKAHFAIGISCFAESDISSPVWIERSANDGINHSHNRISVSRAVTVDLLNLFKIFSCLSKRAYREGGGRWVEARCSHRKRSYSFSINLLLIRVDRYDWKQCLTVS